MTLPAGKRDQQITFNRAVVPLRSALGTNQAASWTNIGLRWANILYGTGAERREAGADRAVQAATFRTLADTLTKTVTARDRIEHNGLTYDIAGIALIGRAEIEFTGTASRG